MDAGRHVLGRVSHQSVSKRIVSQQYEFDPEGYLFLAIHGRLPLGNLRIEWVNSQLLQKPFSA